MNIFAYGSLMIPTIFKAVTGRSLASYEALLNNYARYCLKHDTYPGIVPSIGITTDGVIYFDVDADAIDKLDAFEGSYYLRTPVTATLKAPANGLYTVDATAYVVKPEFRYILSDRPWHFEEFKNRFQASFEKKYVGFKAATIPDDRSST